MYDAIVIGARCAGAPTAMLLARQGYKVLVVDRSAFPSDVPHSTLLIHQPGVALLARWGLLDRVVATGCPPLRRWHVDLGPLALKGSPPPDGDVRDAYAPRRFLLDKLLVDAAVDAGAELRDRFTVDELVMDGDRVVGLKGHGEGGSPVTERARVVIGADGTNSIVARAIGAQAYDERPSKIMTFYTYFAGLRLVEGADIEFYSRTYRGVYAWGTNGGESLVGVNWRASELDEVRANPERAYFAVIDEFAPDFGARIRAAKPAGKLVGGVAPNLFRKPFGPGWALVGDAGAAYEFSSAQGITNAFRQAGLLADALHAWLSGGASFDEALGGFERRRNEIERPYYDFTYHQTTLEPPTPEVLQVIGAVAKSQRASDRFLGLFAQTVAPADFFSPDSISAILAGRG